MGLTKYSAEITKMICKLIETDEYTIREICQNVKISVDTYYQWKEKIPDFSERIKKATLKRLDTFDKEAKKGLLKKLTGYEVKETTVVRRKGIIIEEKETTKHIAPDTTAIIFTLKNTNPEIFNDKNQIEISQTELPKLKVITIGKNN